MTEPTSHIDPYIDSVMDDLLVLWIQHASGYSMARGYSPASPMFRDTKSNWSPYDRDNGVPQEEAKRAMAKAVGEALFRVPNHPQLWRTLLMFEARNLNCEVNVWSNYRLPVGEEYDVLRLEARLRFLKELHLEGCLGG